jgi:hypothetical protein
MTNLFGSFDIEILDLIESWCLVFEISEHFNTRDSISEDYSSIEYSTVKFHIRVQRFGVQWFRVQVRRSRKDLNLSTLNGERGTSEPISL